MEAIIYDYAPEYWNRNYSMKQIDLDNHSEEFKQIQYEVRIALRNTNQIIAGIERYQSVYDFGQFLIRAQLLSHMNCSTYYRVRRFIIISKHYLKHALDYNIDHRRCNLPSLVFYKTLPRSLITSEEIILVVQVLTDNIYTENILPDNNSNYFIDYIIRF